MKTVILNLYKGWKKNSFLLKLFSILSTLLFCITIISSILISIYSDVNSLSLDFSYEGFENFLSIYSFPLKSFAGFLALFTIYVTLKRTYAAEKQIEIMSEQNRISNYFKYREEFVKHCQHSLYAKYYYQFVDSQSSNEEIFHPIFEYYFGSLTSFNNKIRDDVYRDVLAFSQLTSKLPDGDEKNFYSDLLVYQMTVNKSNSPQKKSYLAPSEIMTATYISKLELSNASKEIIYNDGFQTLLVFYFHSFILREVGAFAGVHVNHPFYLYYQLRKIKEKYNLRLPIEYITEAS